MFHPLPHLHAKRPLFAALAFLSQMLQQEEQTLLANFKVTVFRECNQEARVWHLLAAQLPASAACWRTPWQPCPGCSGPVAWAAVLSSSSCLQRHHTVLRHICKHTSCCELLLQT